MFSEALSFDDVLIVPNLSKVSSRSEIDTSVNLLGIPLRVPIISANMKTVTEVDMAIAIADEGGLGVIHRFMPIEEQARQIKLVTNGNVGFAFGLKDWKERTAACLDAGGCIAFLDVAHADAVNVYEVVYAWLREFSTPLVVGNIAISSPLQLYNNYFDRVAFKVGIGGGSMCTTRIMTGCGYPTFQSVYDIYTAFPGAQLIADGGIRSSGDIVKSLGAGATAVMLGSLLAGTKETPGDVFIGTDGRKYKAYRGSASYGDKNARGDAAVSIEGVETMIPYRGSVTNQIAFLEEGLRSGVSYAGYSSVQSLRGSVNFVRITPSGLRESQPHGVSY